MPCRYKLKNRCPPFMKSKTRYNFAEVCAQHQNMLRRAQEPNDGVRHDARRQPEQET